MALLTAVFASIASSAIDVLPVAVFLLVFQRVVTGGPLPNAGRIVIGFLFVLVGLGLFLQGLEMSLFPLGRLMAEQLTDPDFLRAAVVKVAVEITWLDF
jgi:hypothetical protein